MDKRYDRLKDFLYRSDRLALVLDRSTGRDNRKSS
jgi:hypothetical protein